jgi:hypothetical protein
VEAPIKTDVGNTSTTPAIPLPDEHTPLLAKTPLTDSLRKQLPANDRALAYVRMHMNLEPYGKDLLKYVTRDGTNLVQIAEPLYIYHIMKPLNRLSDAYFIAPMNQPFYTVVIPEGVKAPESYMLSVALEFELLVVDEREFWLSFPQSMSRFNLNF